MSVAVSLKSKLKNWILAMIYVILFYNLILINFGIEMLKDFGKGIQTNKEK